MNYTELHPGTMVHEHNRLHRYFGNQSQPLHIDSVIAELPLNESSFQENDPVEAVSEFLQSNPAIPGIILYNTDKSYIGALSRRIFFEALSRPFSLDLFLKKSIGNLFEMVESEELLLLSSDTPIILAVEKALARRSFDDPVIVEFPHGEWRVLDVYHLLVAHSHIHQITVSALKEANELKSELMGIASHDLKNPLGAVIGLSKILKDESENNEQREMAGQICELSAHMLKLVTGLLNSSAAESGKLELKLEFTDMYELASAIVYQNQHQAESKGQTLNLALDDGDEFFVNADAMRLREAMENLVSNGIKYSPAEALITIRLLKHNGKIRFEVKDQGPGLTREDMEKLFGKFRKLTAKPTGGESSTGLGLYISKQIVELHGGTVFAESKAGHGAIFVIEIPSVESD
ncbi:MAG TPA: ATP-binding protein [Patescibacteria group bacterium]|nr:ATP-binding protein [Patescibacteria group bacterium]